MYRLNKLFELVVAMSSAKIRIGCKNISRIKMKNNPIGRKEPSSIKPLDIKLQPLKMDIRDQLSLTSNAIR